MGTSQRQEQVWSINAQSLYRDDERMLSHILLHHVSYSLSWVEVRCSFVLPPQMFNRLIHLKKPPEPGCRAPGTGYINARTWVGAPSGLGETYSGGYIPGVLVGKDFYQLRNNFCILKKYLSNEHFSLHWKRRKEISEAPHKTCCYRKIQQQQLKPRWPRRRISRTRENCHKTVVIQKCMKACDKRTNLSH